MLGMTCSSCARLVESNVGSLPGVRSARVNLATETLHVELDPGRAGDGDVAAAVRRAGYRLGGGEDRLGGAGAERAQAWPLAVGLALTVPLVVYSMARDLGLPALPHDRAAMLAASTLVQLVVGAPFYRRAFLALRAGTAGMDLLVVLGSTVAWGTSAGVAAGLVPGRDVYFETGAAIVTLVSLGRFLEARAKRRASEAVRALLDLRSPLARVVRAGVEEEVGVGGVGVGELVVVRPGERVPLDGTVEEGRSAVDESMLTGESRPAQKGPGDEAVGGTLNRDGLLRVRVSRVGADTALARIVRLVEEAQAGRAPIQRLADDVGRHFVPLVLLAALATFLGWVFVARIEAAGAALNAVAVLVAACPCAIGLATPMAILVGTARGASRGILFRSGEALEKAGQATVVVLDKTGTLTRGEPALTDVVAARAGDERLVLRLAASAERGSEHPVARAVTRAAEERGLETQAPEELRAIPGEGVRARVGGRDVLVGTLRLVKGAGIDAGGLEAAVEGLEEEGKTAVVVAASADPGGRLEALGVLAAADAVKPEARQAVEELQRLGLEVVLLTGDNYATAEAVARKVGITRVRAEVRPGEKADVVRNLKTVGVPPGAPAPVVVMVGDGTNDAPALARADAGIALGTGTDVAKEAAGVTLVSDDLRGVGRAIALSRATHQAIVQNLVWALFYNVALVPVAAYGLLSPMAAAGAMTFSSLFVVLGSLRLRRAPLEAFVPPKRPLRQGLELLPRVLAPAAALATLLVVPMLAMGEGAEIRGVLAGTMTPGLMMVMAIANGLIAVSYASIPVFLVVFKARRKDLPFSWVLFLFGAFILACGTTHFVHVVGLWRPVDAWQAAVDTVCALASVGTAVVLWPLLPRILALPSPEQLRVVNRALAEEKDALERTQEELRKAYAEVERRVEVRTAELARANEALVAEVRERERTEEELRRSRNMLALVMDSIPQAVFWKDPASVYLGCNRPMALRAGLDAPEAISGRTDFDLPWTREEAEAYRADDRKVLEEGRPRLRYLESQTVADGSTRWLETSKVPLRNGAGEAWGVLGIFEDVTERRDAQSRLLEYRKVIESSADLIALVDVHGRVALANRAFLEFRGRREEEVVGRPIGEALGEAVLAQLEAPLHRALAGSEQAFSLAAETPGGGRCDFSGLCTPVLEEGAVSRVALVLRDVSEQRKLEAQLLQAQKMEAVGQLAGGVAHDFNNILSIILGYSELLRPALSGEPKHLERLEQVLSAADRASQLTRALLAFSRKQVMSPKDVELDDVVRRVQKMLARVIGEDVKLRTVANDAGLVVHADAAQLEQALLNLATNARDAMPRGGSLTVETSRMSIDDAFVSAHGWGSPGMYAVLSVADTGCGMDAETVQRVFEPFFTTKEPGKGTGLGMSIVYGIVKQHRGYMNVYSEPGHGTTVRIYLPLVEAARPAPAASPGPAPARGGSETILVAEDEASVRGLMATVLRDAGYEVILAEDGQEAVEKLAASGERVRLVLLDMIMPRKGGREAYEEIRALRPGVRVLFSSGYSPDLLESRGGRSEARDLLTKPFQPQELLRRVREALDR